MSATERTVSRHSLGRKYLKKEQKRQVRHATKRMLDINKGVEDDIILPDFKYKGLDYCTFGCCYLSK